MKTDCEKCDKPTWKGCGKHIEQALKDVPEDERCKCPRDLPASTATETKKIEETKNDTEESKVETIATTEESKVETTATTEETKEKVD
jgi:hypothetical protein